MCNLSVNTFLEGGTDLEDRQYHVMSGLKQCYGEFAHNRLYPSLLELVDLHAALVSLLNTMNDMQNRFPHSLKEVDLEHNKLVYDDTNTGDDELQRAAELIVDHYNTAPLIPCCLNLDS